MNFEHDEIHNEDCVGCGRTPVDVLKEDEITIQELEEYSVFTNSGDWYCHRDCLRDSQ